MTVLKKDKQQTKKQFASQHCSFQFLLLLPSSVDRNFEVYLITLFTTFKLGLKLKSCFSSIASSREDNSFSFLIWTIFRGYIRAKIPYPYAQGTVFSMHTTLLKMSVNCSHRKIFVRLGLG